MPPPLKPAQIAKEAFKRLDASGQEPTPPNYKVAYDEVAGEPSQPHFPEEPLRRLAQMLPTPDNPTTRAVTSIEQAITRENWAAFRNSVLDYVMKLEQRSGTPTPDVQAQHLDFREQVARLVEHITPALGSDNAHFAAQAADLAALLRQADAELANARQGIADFNLQVSFAGEEQGAIRSTLLHLLHLLLDNIAALGVDDRWLTGQVSALVQVAQPPLDLRRLDDVKRKLQDVIAQQSQARQRSLEAQAQIKLMLATFIERLSQMNDHTGQFRDEVETFARVVESASALDEIGPALQSVLSATRTMEANAQQVNDELRTIRERAAQAEQEVAKLQTELDRASSQARMDPLTGALNRRGLDEAFAREVMQAARKGSSLCLALLDIDNFKQLNDTHGHDTGDAALNHLVSVARACIRPQDTLARYGGEEFVILLPDTTLQNGVEAMQRLQRELTKRFFLQDNQRLLITFSAGVAQLTRQESADEAVKRADHAMYLAKRAGKNRVFAAN